ncbi:MAG TPA: hypothetical protein VEG68_02105 [Terriglobales bacterium]|nr:hypothetical protein [Terriglobales bacterium]
MSTLVELIPRPLEEEVAESVAVEASAAEASPAKTVAWSLASFAEEQIRRLVQQVFLTGRNKRARQVVFSAVDQETDVASLCILLGEALSRQDSGTTCVVEAQPCPWAKGAVEDIAPANYQTRFGVLRDASQQLSHRLWFMPRDVLLDGNDGRYSALWLRGRLAELRLEFDYTVLQGPAAGAHSEAALLGSLCDGVVLVLRANSTRRVAAQRVKEVLHAANARVLGAVLSERTFPIPEAIYKRL